MNAPFRHGEIEPREVDPPLLPTPLELAPRDVPREAWAIAAIVGLAMARALWLIA